MTIVSEEIYIPEKRYIQNKYVAEDGTQFNGEQECLKYEEQLKNQEHPVIKSCIYNINIYDISYNGVLYYFSSEDDYDFLIKHLGLINTTYSCFKSDFLKYGIGWYLYWEEIGEYMDYRYLMNFDAYVENLEADLKEWKEDIQRRIYGGTTL